MTASLVALGIVCVGVVGGLMLLARLRATVRRVRDVNAALREENDRLRSVALGRAGVHEPMEVAGHE